MSLSIRVFMATASVCVAAIGLASPASGQQGPGWFVPNSQPAQATGPAPRPRPAPVAAPAPRREQVPSPRIDQFQPQGQAPQQEPPPLQVQLPPVPDLPALPKSTPPPAAVIGVLGVPDIMRAATAAQQVEKAITERREKLNEDAQKEQAAWRDLQQALGAQRANLNPDQIRTKERELQERITNSQKQLRDRNRFIQESAQVGLAQIERMLISVIRQVAESHGMNLVLRREQVALNVNEFDITDGVVEQLNKVLPRVTLPPDGVSPVAFLAPGGPGGVPAAPSGGPRVTPTAAPATALPTDSAPPAEPSAASTAPRP